MNRHSPLRILDANLNRAREAIRVMEDAARFLLDDAALCGALKELRHDVTAAATALPALGAPEAQRDTPGDVGAPITSDSERARADLRGVVAAAGKRLGEALRSLEEFGKLVDDRFALRMKAARYVGYDLEQRLLARTPCDRAGQWRLCVLVTESLCRGRSWEAVAEAAIGGGADAIQLREKTLPDAELLRRARRLVALCSDRAASIVNDRPDVALLAGADGVHLGQGDLPIAEVRSLVGRRLIIGASTHDLGEAARAVADGADCCGVGAMFASSTKERPTSGVEYLRAFLAAHPSTPHLAIGGITLDNVGQLAAAGCRGIAVSSTVCGADDPAAVVRALAQAVGEAARLPPGPCESADRPAS